MTEDIVTVVIDDNRKILPVFGQYDQNIARIEQRLDVVANTNGNHVTFSGEPHLCEKARAVVQRLLEKAEDRNIIDIYTVDSIIREAEQQGNLFHKNSFVMSTDDFESFSTKKRGAVRARNQAQNEYIKKLRESELVISDGPAGTGKTWLAVGYAVSLLEKGLVEKLIISRPAVEAGERLGFLPGDMREKIDPYLRPVFDSLADFMDSRVLERGLTTGVIEVAPLAFMRGRTLSNACILLDEAQNATSVQMKMFLTRLGEGSRMIVNGDPSQIDLPGQQSSGLVEAIKLLSHIEEIGRVRFDENDVVRHELVAKIVNAYGNK